ncbi:transcription antitermination factor NusB [Ferriphaselus sp. R-1]|uniref:transcription antitermination factor NusB n=1 Tax=Ferriphaselus sp. R-1 TaxID=1485544 RepID=UPI000551AEF5|nr:transcription antitermination factor NusB [Ferriphaselus sp. R-1]
MSDTKNTATAKSARRRSRELAMQGVYQWRLSGEDIGAIEQMTRDEKSLGRYDSEFYSDLLRGVLNRIEILTEAIAPHLDRPVNDLSPVEYSVLLLGAYELAHHPEIPYRVIINEEVELAKTFGGSDGHKFVNGVLDKLAATLRSDEVRGA